MRFSTTNDLSIGTVMGLEPSGANQKPEEKSLTTVDSEDSGTSLAKQPSAAVNSTTTEQTDMEGMVRIERISVGKAHFNRLGWKRLTVVLIVEAVALGSLSLPHAFASLGMLAGVSLTVIVGCMAMYTSYIVGQVKIANLMIAHYTDVGRLLAGRWGYEVFSVMFVMQLLFLVGGHCLTGAIALVNITNSNVCSLWFGAVSAVVLLLAAIPPSFAEVAILGYLDLASILLAIGITIVATGVRSAQAEGGLAAVAWSAWPKEDLTFSQAFVAISNVVLSYAFAVCQISFMDEMHRPTTFVRSIWVLGITQIVIYTLTGGLIYAFVGPEVQPLAILSAGGLISKIAFGVALPVIFISGSINTTVMARYIHGRIYQGTVTRYINTPKGWITWLALILVITIFAWIIAEAIPFFSNLLSICSSLFITGFTLYFPPVMWFKLLRKGNWYSRANLLHSVANLVIFIVGITVLVGGTYASIHEIMAQYEAGTVRGAYTCMPPAGKA